MNRTILTLLMMAVIPWPEAGAQFYTAGKTTERKTEDGQRGEETASIDLQAVADSLAREFGLISLPLNRIHVTSPYGMRKDPITGRRSMHSGLDLRARHEAVYAMMEGKVVETGYDRRSGIYVRLSHGTYSVSYCHLSRVLVAEGDSVQAGQPVAITGNSGRSTAEHLHVTCRRNGKTEDPMTLIGEIARRRRNLLEEAERIAGIHDR